eukprot:COSAG02_NODE_467_length_21771_cov_39.020303_10_plen_723_part_00
MTPPPSFESDSVGAAGGNISVMDTGSHSTVATIGSVNSTGDLDIGSTGSVRSNSSALSAVSSGSGESHSSKQTALEDPLLAPPGAAAAAAQHSKLTRSCVVIWLVAVIAGGMVWRLLWIYGPAGTTVMLSDGRQLQGILNAKRAREFRGLPYAAPPIGARRWMPPSPVLETQWPSDRVYDASYHRSMCPQYDQLGLGWAWSSLGASGRSSSEDCLYLAIYAPPLSRLRGVMKTKKVPVLVFIHGGANLNGGSDDTQLDGSYLAHDPSSYPPGQDAVVVVPNFRLGVFGYLGSELLRARNGTGNSTGNYGQQDVRQVLKWVSDNIAAFGGDPTRVLLFGESTGATAVAMQLVAETYHKEATPSPFSAVALQSGAVQPWASKPMAEAQAVFEALLTRVGCNRSERQEQLECLLSRSTVELYNASYAAEPGDLPYADGWYSCQFAPVIDGVELLETPASLLEARGPPPTVRSVLLGTNRDEGTQSVYLDSGQSNAMLPYNLSLAGLQSWAVGEWGEANGARVLELYGNESIAPGSSLGISSHWWGATRAVGDMLYTCPARRAARHISKQLQRAAVTEPRPERIGSDDEALATSGASTWLYYFKQVPHSPAASYGLQGACHGCEMAFVWRNQAELTGGERETTLSRTMSSAWYQLAKTGAPNDEGSGAGWHWRPFVEGKDEGAMEFGGDTVAAMTPQGGGLRTQQCDFWDTVPPHAPAPTFRGPKH